jgi:hypothetical protein
MDRPIYLPLVWRLQATRTATMNPPDQFHFYLQQLFMPQPNQYIKTEFKIKIGLLPQKLTRHRYMYQDGKLDYLGQLLTQLGYNVDGKYRFPSELGKVISPFTQPCRGSIIDTHTTLSILELDLLPSQEHRQRLADLLPQWNITFTS